MQTGMQPAGSSDRWLATGGVIGAVLASSCCILPLVLVAVGIGGAWVSHLTALAPYQPMVLGATVPVLGIGLWHVYRRPVRACAPGSPCALPQSGRLTKTALWVGVGLVLLSATAELWAPLFW